MKALKIISGTVALIPSMVAYFITFVSASIWNATKEGWRDGS